MPFRSLALFFAVLTIARGSAALGQSGALIGVAKSGRYETLWIVGDASRPLRATIPALLVPRADGWWRVGTAPSARRAVRTMKR